MTKRSYVLPRSLLVDQGFIPANPAGHAYYMPLDVQQLAKLLRLAELQGSFRERGGDNDVEQDPSVQQLILYAYVQTPDGKVMLYQRGHEGYSETRLHGRISIGIGGHMELVDKSLTDAFYRELDEEVVITQHGHELQFSAHGETDIGRMQEYIGLEPRGLIKDERDDVGAVHLGIACRLIIKHEMSTKLEIRAESGENIRSFFVTPDEYISLKKRGEIEPEGWTDLVFQKEILKDAAK